MSYRLLALTGYLLYLLATSLTGAGYLALSIAFYWFAFRTSTPEPDYFILVLGGYGAALAFLLALSFASRAHEAASYPILVRLQSRVEYLTAVLLATQLATWLILLTLAALILVRNSPNLTLSSAMLIPPIWLSLTILFAVLALHASDFVTAGWSRVAIFGTLALFLLLGENNTAVGNAFASFFQTISQTAYEQGWLAVGEMAHQAGNWFAQGGSALLGELVGLLFWPFHALTTAVISGNFTPTQALAPATILLYATILFLLAADFFANKDLFLVEE
jgi:hypothetical protein